MPALHVFDDLIDFIARLNPEQVIAYHPAEAVVDRAWELAERKRAGVLTGDEAQELNGYLELEHIIQMAKARALMHLQKQ